MPKIKRASGAAEFRKRLLELAKRPEEIRGYLDRALPLLRGPSVDDFKPRSGFAGSTIVITGRNFSPVRGDNLVSVGGKPALVVEAAAGRLRVISDKGAVTGPVSVKIGAKTAAGPCHFRVRPYPEPGSGKDGPPIYFAGKGLGAAGDVPSIGTLNVLVVLVNPSDRVPAAPAALRTTVEQGWTTVHDFYDQASYGRLDVDVDLTANWHTLTGTFTDYVSQNPVDGTWVPNVRPDVLDRLMAEAAQAAVNEGLDLDDYQVMACVMNLNGAFIRAWGGWSSSSFSYNDGSGTNIALTVDHDLNLLVAGEGANWGRFAHELGHNIVAVPPGLSAPAGAAVLGEDVYDSDLVDPAAATADPFDMMGGHDDHPIFSGYYLDKLGYFNGANILDLQWDRNAFDQEYDVVAHGLAENAAAARYHLLRIRVADGLYYYVEVRQRPGATAQVFDGSIPLDGALNQGGVVVTKVITGTVNFNQQMRFITLLHDPRVLRQGQTATDPARALQISVTDEDVAARPLVCRVRVAWAQGIADDPNGAFDLRIDPWDSAWQTPDIWVDRAPFGAYDQGRDAANRPLGNGDKPRPDEINRFWARVHCDGTVDASNVRVTYYAVEPPGVGDNGNWAPLRTVTVPSIVKNSFADASVDWVPEVGRHTCLKVWAEQQLGEISGSNNWAQENVFDFEAPASSVPDPIVVSTAVRNPYKERTIVLLGVKGVPEGFTVHYPHAWVWLDPLEERRLELTVFPTMDYFSYRKHEIFRADVRVDGFVPRSYRQEFKPGINPGSVLRAIGGLTARVTPKRRVQIRLQQDKEQQGERTIGLSGSLKPAMANEVVRVELRDPDDRLRIVERVTDTLGRFKATFDLRRKPNLDVTAKPERNDRPVGGRYTARAFTVNSPNAAQAASNLVTIVK